MQSENITLIIAVAGAIGAISATLIGGLLTFWGQWLARRSEERRHVMDLCFKAAAETLVREIEIAKASGFRGPIAPVDLYIIHTMALMSLLQSGQLSQTEMITRWIEIKKNTKAAFEAGLQAERENNSG